MATEQELKEGAERGDPQLQYELARFYFDKAAHKEAAFWFMKAGEQGHAAAQIAIGDMHRDGQGVSRDLDLAKLWYQKAESLNHADAKNRLGLLAALDTAEIKTEEFFAAVGSAFLLAAVAVLLPFLAKTYFTGSPVNYWIGKSVFVFIGLLPFLQGLLTGFMLGKRKTEFGYYAGASLMILVIDIIVAYLCFGEGALCLLIAVPIVFAAIIGGLAFGRMLGKSTAKRFYSSVLPLALLVSAHSATLPPPDFKNEIGDAVVINAPPEVVWRYIIQYPENKDSPEYWLWKIGLPMPIQSVATGNTVGAARECRFTRDIVFKEKLTEVIPGKRLTFDITEQPAHPEIIGHFRLDKGQLQLKPNDDGTTTVTAISWYHLYVSPAGYFDLWASDIVREVHFRVLNHMKELAETDYMKEKANKK